MPASTQLEFVSSLQEMKVGQGLRRKDTYQRSQECKAMKVDDHSDKNSSDARKLHKKSKQKLGFLTIGFIWHSCLEKGRLHFVSNSLVLYPTQIGNRAERGKCSLK